MNYLSQFRNKLRRKLFNRINPFYQQLFASELKSSRGLEATSADLLSSTFLADLDQSLNYFLFHASFADKWFILSYLREHLEYYIASRVLAAFDDKPLIELFMGRELTLQKFIFMESEHISALSSVFRPVSRLSLPIADIWCQLAITPYFMANGLPTGSIRHLHIVYYPYFSDLFHIHGVPYSKLLKMLLYLPSSSKPAQPTFYEEGDYLEAMALVKSGLVGSESRTVLFNVVNFSHQSLSISQIRLICYTLVSRSFFVLVNVAQSAATTDIKFSCADIGSVSFIDVPPRLLALVSKNVDAVIGVLGGAMNIAAQYSDSHVLSLQTPAVGVGCDEDDLCAEWGKGRMWEWYDLDWNCIFPGRIIENDFIGDPSLCSDERLTGVIESFLDRLVFD